MSRKAGLDLEEACMPELEVDSRVGLSRLTASPMLASERPLHSDTEVDEAERQKPTLCASGSLQCELTFHCDIWWWLRETWRLPKTTEYLKTWHCLAGHPGAE